MTSEDWIRKGLRRAYDMGDGSLGYAAIAPFDDSHYPDEIELMVGQLLELLAVEETEQ